MANGTSTNLWNWNDLVPKWLQKFYRMETAVTIALAFWIMWLLWCLGTIKVIHMVITGELDFPVVTEPVLLFLNLLKMIVVYLFKEFFPEQCDACWTAIEKCVMMFCAKCLCVLTCGRIQANNIEVASERKVGRGWRRPRHCNGMCAGAKDARRRHRKQMRINKRKGKRSDIPWFQKPYICSCKVK